MGIWVLEIVAVRLASRCKPHKFQGWTTFEMLSVVVVTVELACLDEEGIFC